jgi:site-specific recombinase XerC
MAKVLPFPLGTAHAEAARKKNATRNRLAVGYALETVALESGEALPLLIRTNEGTPMSLAMRWVVLKRRSEVAESTLRADVDALRFLYAWGDRVLAGGLEARLEGGAGLTHDEVLRLKAYLLDPRELDIQRDGPGDAGDAQHSATAGRRAAVALRFLQWAVVPAERNSAGAAPAGLAGYVGMLTGILQPLAKHAGKGRRRIAPLTDADARRVEQLIAPKVDRGGRWLLPLQWHRDNPFSATVRIRAWLMWVLARDAGLRLGELLTLSVDNSFELVDDIYCVKVVRKPDAAADPRGKRPQVKTLSRAVPAGPRAQAARRAYLTDRGKGARPRGSGAYLFASQYRKPLSVSAASRMMDVINRAASIDISWHSLRHAWAERLAHELLIEAEREAAAGGYEVAACLADKLRYLGGWSDTSRMPLYYAQNAIAAAARRTLASIQERRANRIVSVDPNTNDKPLPWEDEL